MSWELVYSTLPFLMSIWVKVVAKWFLRPMVKQAIADIPGGDLRGFDNEGVADVITNYIVHAEQKLLVVLSYFSSICAGVILGIREGITNAAVVGGVILAAVGILIHGFLQASPKGALDEPLKRLGGLSTSTLVFLATILVDLVLMVLAAVAALS